MKFEIRYHIVHESLSEKALQEASKFDSILPRTLKIFKFHQRSCILKNFKVSHCVGQV
jgi:hypothetical protein